MHERVCWLVKYEIQLVKLIFVLLLLHLIHRSEIFLWGYVDGRLKFFRLYWGYRSFHTELGGCCVHFPGKHGKILQGKLFYDLQRFGMFLVTGGLLILRTVLFHECP